MQDNASLISRCVQYDAAAWDELVRLYTPLILKAIRIKLLRMGFGRRSDMIDDIYQTVILDLFSQNLLSRIHHAKSLKQYLYSICISKTIDLTRKVIREYRVVETPGDLEDLSEDMVDGRVSELNSDSCYLSHFAHEKQLLDKAMHRLSLRDELILRLRWNYGLSFKEISRRLNIPIGTLSSIVLRSQKRLRVILERQGID